MAWNNGVEDLTFSTQLLKIKAKLKFWKPVKLTLIGKIKVLNISIQDYGTARNFMIYQDTY